MRFAPLFLVLLLTACDAESLQDPDGQLPPGNGAVQIGGFEREDLRGTPFDLRQARFVGNDIELTVAYSGGCMEHGFRLLADEAVALSMPPQLGVHVIHDDPGDDCEAYPTEVRRIDASPLVQWFNSPFVVHLHPVDSSSDVITLFWEGK
ncbi:MAG: hypothetical protein O3C45_05495 [Bacteroidetes bacterium]|nr:hypothetical protein [Bacteroidota bacterium]MDA0874501.1 hypothetical protein [Bacteroidota bacterium]